MAQIELSDDEILLILDGLELALEQPGFGVKERKKLILRLEAIQRSKKSLPVSEKG